MKRNFKILFISLLIIFALWTTCVDTCMLCPLRIPPKPKPLDQFRIPSIEKIIDTSDTIGHLCHNSTRLDTVQETCRNDVTHLFCSLTTFIENYKRECPSGAENVEECSKCQRESASIYDKNAWIMTWLDSIGKMPSGISDGNYHWLGDYEQCQQLKDQQIFNGRYCLLEFQIPDAVLRNVQCENYDPLEVHLGICLPAGCSLAETKELVEHVADHEVNVYCQPPRQWPILAKLFLAFVLLWICVVLGATAVRFFCPLNDKKAISERSRATAEEEDLLTNCKSLSHDQNRHATKSWLNHFILAFSLQENARASLRTTRHYSRNFHSVQGLQVVSVVLVIFGNIFFLMMPYLENVAYFYYLFELWLLQPLVNSSFYVDGLLALGALRLMLKANQGFETFLSFLMNTGKRFLRIWPTYAFITLFVLLLYVRLGEGPMWSHNDLAQRCQSSWYTNLLFINNLIGFSETCLDGGFLIALEAQFYFAAFVLLFLLGSRRLSRYLMNFSIWTLIFVSVAYTFFVSFRYFTVDTLIPTFSAPFADRGKTYMNFINKLYLNPLSRIAPFLLGLILPPHFCNSRIFNSQIFAPLIWLCCFFLVVFVVWMPYFLAFDVTRNALFTRSLSAFYCATHRLAWAFFILFLANFLNKSNPKSALNAMLGWRIFHPLSKLVYIVFLISEPVALSLFSSLHRPIYATPLSTFLTSVGTLVCSFIIAFIIDIFYTRPITNMVAVAFSK